MKRIYCDGVFDLFHSGHLKHLRHIREHFSEPIFLLVGVISDKQSTEYKRRPIVDETRRLNTIMSCIYVDDGIITNQLIMTEEFIKQYNIDYIVHALTSDDREKQRSFFEIPIKLGKFIELDYNNGISTTELINAIQTNNNILVSKRHNDCFGILQQRMLIKSTHTVGEFGYTDDAISSYIKNYYCIDNNLNQTVDFVHLYISPEEKMFQNNFFDYIIVNNLDKFINIEELLDEYKRITKCGIYITNICKINEDVFFYKGFTIVKDDCLYTQGFDAYIRYDN